MNKRMYLAWCPDLGGIQEGGARVKEDGPDRAAEEWAERYDRDSAEYKIVSGQTVTVHVLDIETDRETRWIVAGEAVPIYSATEAEDDDE